MADVYDPAEDSWLLQKWVKKCVTSSMNVLDVGCGSGIQSATAHEQGATVLGIDCNPDAIAYCRKTYPSRRYPAMSFVESDLFSKVTGTFDCIICNPPYLPDAGDAQEITSYTTGGKKGYEFIGRLLRHAATHLTSKGCILLLFSTLTNKEKVDEFIMHYGFQSEQLEQQSFFYEKLFCYRLTKTPILATLNAHAISEVAYLAKGARGVVFSGKYKKKKCAIKTKNVKSKAPAALQRETDMLKRVNAFGIGPQLYITKSAFVIMEYIEGMKLMDYIQKYPSQKLHVIIQVLEQLHMLDLQNIEKKELVRPYKHILVRKRIPVLLDFERATISRRPHNVPQFLQFLTRMVYPQLRRDTQALAQAYIASPVIKPIITALKKAK